MNNLEAIENIPGVLLFYFSYNLFFAFEFACLKCTLIDAGNIQQSRTCLKMIFSYATIYNFSQMTNINCQFSGGNVGEVQPCRSC